MITTAQGNLLKADVEALVNTVNCVGYMGKGIALQFKKAVPENFAAYSQACKAGQVVPGKIFIYKPVDALLTAPYIINFPTKRHWRNTSRMEDIESGLVDLVEQVKVLGIKSIAIPPLGCGLGGLDWSEVRPRIVQAFSHLPEVEVLLYEPRGAPAAEAQIINTLKPEMTRAQALLILLMAQYHQFDYRLSLLEIHKLAYFLQEQGEPLKLQYSEYHYGPYARNLRFLLQKMEGHYISNLRDDEQPDREVKLLDGAVEAAESFLARDASAKENLAQVSEIISGFETPYGMELLASLHWVISRQKIQDVQAAAVALARWSTRKANLFQSHHIDSAWQQLHSG